MVWTKIERFFSKREHQLLVLVTVAALVLRLMYAFNQGMWVDEGRHALVATALLEHPFEYASPYHGVITNLPPVYPYLLTLSMAVLGWGKTAVYIVSPIVGAATVFLTYFLGREMFGVEEGVIAATLLATSPVFFFLSERLLIGATLTFFYVAAVLLFYYALEDRKYSKYAWWALGPVTALALLTKQPAYLLGPVFLIYFLVHEGRDLLEVKDNPMKYRDMYIGVVLGIVTLLPWLLRNLSVCGQPLCSSSKALNHITNTDPAAWTNTAGPFYYFFNLVSVLSLPVAVVGYIRYVIVEGYIAIAERNVTRVGYAFVGTIAASFLALLTFPRLVPMILLLGVAAMQEKPEELLLWLWVAFGVGFMSTVAIKVPRYIVFVVPALLLIISRFFIRVKDWLAENTALDMKMALMIVAAVTVALSGLAFMDAQDRVESLGQGFSQLEPAGRWFEGRNVTVMASSPRQLMFYSRNNPGIEIIPKNNTEVERRISNGAYDYVVVDAYERTRAEQAAFIQNELIPIGLLQPVEVFRNNGRPEVVIYEVRP